MCDHVVKGVIIFYYVPSQDNWADIFMKAILYLMFTEQVNTLWNKYSADYNDAPWCMLSMAAEKHQAEDHTSDEHF